MNKQELSKMRGKQVRLSPIARRFDERQGVELQPVDDAWMIMSASRDSLEIRNPRSGQSVQFGTDHVIEHLTDLGSSDGVLLLKSQIFLFVRQMPRVEPLHPWNRQ
jgi:hypothetical protein